jgi:hypothetical protein
MKHSTLKSKALKMRRRGQSYNSIKLKLGMSKSTLSLWFRDMPLSKERINKLRANNPERIKKFRDTMAKKQLAVQDLAYKNISKDVGVFSNRDLFISGLFLYWAEGSKTKKTAIALTNTNPQMLTFFIKWLGYLGVNRNKLKVNLHLYSDMNIESAIDFWVKTLKISKSQFRRPYIKESKLASVTYKNGYRHGTCSVIYENKKMTDYVLMGIKHLQTLS